MANYFPNSLKRKDLELDHFDDDAFDFTLSSPASKIRRLDADLRPMMEAGETDMATQFAHQPFSEFRSSDGGQSRLQRLVIEELPPDDNQERAIVLFNPTNTPLCRSPSNYVVDSDLMSTIRGNREWEINSKSSRYIVEEEGSKPDEQLAVIPWIPSQQMHHIPPPKISEMEFCDPMDAEETTMDAEDSMVGLGFESNKGFNQPNWNSTNTVPQWQQQHCLHPQIPHNTISPIVWYR